MAETDWKRKLTPEQYHVLREKGTEPPGSGKYIHHSETGLYTCAGCGAELFRSETKYESTMPGLIGWPAFTEAAQQDAVELRADLHLGMQRTEVICKNCGGHLGHLFDDPSSPNGKHYCMNSCALNFDKKADNDRE